MDAHTHGGTDAPECTTCAGRRPPGKHQGPWRRCQSCGHPENDHPFRHPFVPKLRYYR